MLPSVESSDPRRDLDDLVLFVLPWTSEQGLETGEK